jgi:hypothetical protein
MAAIKLFLNPIPQTTPRHMMNEIKIVFYFDNYIVNALKNLSKELVSIRKSSENRILFRSPVSPLTSSGAPGKLALAKQNTQDGEKRGKILSSSVLKYIKFFLPCEEDKHFISCILHGSMSRIVQR